MRKLFQFKKSSSRSQFHGAAILNFPKPRLEGKIVRFLFVQGLSSSNTVNVYREHDQGGGSTTLVYSFCRLTVSQTNAHVFEIVRGKQWAIKLQF